MCRHDDMPERTLDEPDPHAHDEPPEEYEHEDEPNSLEGCTHDEAGCPNCGGNHSSVDPLESGVDLVETLWLIGTGKTLKEWTTK